MSEFNDYLDRNNDIMKGIGRARAYGKAANYVADIALQAVEEDREITADDLLKISEHFWRCADTADRAIQARAERR